MQAATISELETALPKADPLFLLDQLKKDASIAEAKDAFITNQSAQLEMRDGEIEKLKAGRPAEKRKPGVAPIGRRFGTTTSGDSRTEFNALVAEKCKSGKSRQLATAAVFRENPGLREAMVDEANN